MVTRLQMLWDTTRSSLWALPLLMICLAIALAVAAIQVQLPQFSSPVWYFYSGNSLSAGNFLSALLTSMITMATLAVSITVVVLTLAAQQLGSRLIRNFIGDRRTQISLGTFISTVVYLLIVLRTTSGASDNVPNLAVTIGTVLVLVSVVTMVLFVHHLARSIVADNLIDRVGADLDAYVASLLPENDAPPMPSPLPNVREKGAPVRLPCGGYVQALDHQRLVQIARSAGATIELAFRPGQHAVPETVYGYVLPSSALTPELISEIAASLVMGNERTPVQDLEFSIRQLVEVAVRAMSPGINDPYTAIAAIDRLTLSLSKIMRRKPSQSVWCDEDGKVRLIVPVSTFEGTVDAAFHQIRQQGERIPAVIIRLAEDLIQLLDVASPEQRPAIEKHLRLVLQAGRRSIPEPEDLRDLQQRIEALLGRKPS